MLPQLIVILEISDQVAQNGIKISPQAVRALMEKWKVHKTVQDLPHKRKPRKTSKVDDRNIVRDVLKARRRLKSNIAKKYKVSPRTLRRRMHEAGYVPRKPRRGVLLSKVHILVHFVPTDGKEKEARMGRPIHSLDPGRLGANIVE